MMDDVRRLEDCLRATAFEYNSAVANQHIGLAHRLSQRIQAIERSLTIQKYGPLATKPEPSCLGEVMGVRVEYVRTERTVVTYELPLPATLDLLMEMIERIQDTENLLSARGVDPRLQLSATSEMLVFTYTKPDSPTR